MHHLNPVRTGLALGKLFALVHLAWAALVWLGFAQGLVNFVLWAHMVSSPTIVGPFSIQATLYLVIITGVLGYVLGYVFAKIWNLVHKK